MRRPPAHTVLPLLALGLSLELPRSASAAPAVASFGYSPASPLTGELVKFT